MASEYQQGLPGRARIARRLREIPTSAQFARLSCFSPAAAGKSVGALAVRVSRSSA